MANYDFPRGFVPSRYLDGSQAVCQPLPISSTNGEIKLYDLIERRTDGYFHPAQAGSLTLAGVACEYVAANTGGNVLVDTNPAVVMLAQASGSEINEQSDFDLNYDIVVSSTTTKRSGMEINSATGAATANLPIKILSVAPAQDSNGNELGANVLLECVFNQHLFKGAGIAG